jgi:hypothetical protein
MNLEKNIDGLWTEIATLDKVIAIFEKLSRGRAARARESTQGKTAQQKGRRRRSPKPSRGSLRLLK